jgi:hypothetical protein
VAGSRCAHCNEEHEAGAAFCPQTGQPIAASPPRDKSLPSWATVPVTDGALPVAAGLPPPDAPPRGVGELLQQAVFLYRSHARVFLTTAAVLFLPASLLCSAALALLMARAGATVGAAAAAGTGLAQGALAAFLLGVLGWVVMALIVYGLVMPLTSGALTIAVADRVLGLSSTWREHWRLLLGRLGLLLSALIPAAVLCMIGYAFLIIPGLVLSFLFAFVPTVVLLEGVGGTAALRRSVALVRSDWPRVALVFITFAFLNVVAHMVGAFFVPRSAVFAGHVLGDLLTLVLLPVPVMGAVLLYLDLRRRHDQLDEAALRAQVSALRTRGP